MSPSRFENQIATINQVFEDVHARFLKKQPVDNSINTIFRTNKKYGSRDRRYISSSIFGVFRWYGWLVDLIEKDLKIALLLGYLFDRNPVDSFVNYWAETCGFNEEAINKLYDEKRNLIEDNHQFISKACKSAEIVGLNPKFTHEIANKFIDYLQLRPRVWLRVTSQMDATVLEYIKTRNIDYLTVNQLPNVLGIESKINLNQMAAYRSGLVEVQDISSQAIGLICDPKPGELWWDVCAGSGGKSLHLADLMENKGEVIATETEPRRFNELLRRLKKNKTRKTITPIQWNGVTVGFDSTKLSGVLIDSPCSCSGTWRRSPDLRWNTTLEDIKEYSKIQFQILARVCEVVPENCLIIYATCSMFPKENEEVIDRLLDKFKDIEPCSFSDPITGLKRVKDLYLAPPDYDGNIMYVSKLMKK